MTGPNTWWRVGSDHGLVWEWGMAVVTGEIELGQVTSLWATLAPGSDLGHFLQTLGTATGRSVLNLPDFAVVVYAPDCVHVAVRGRCVVVLEVADDQTTVEGGGMTTWVERRVERAGFVELIGGAQTSGESRPMYAGVVPCSSLSKRPAPGSSSAQVAAAQLDTSTDAADGANSTEMIRLPDLATAGSPAPEPRPVPEAPISSEPAATPVPAVTAAPAVDEHVPEPSHGLAAAPGTMVAVGDRPEPADPAVAVPAVAEVPRPAESDTLDDAAWDDRSPVDPAASASPTAESAEGVGDGAGDGVGDGVGDDLLGLWQRDHTSMDGVEAAAVRVVEEPGSAAVLGQEFISSVPKNVPAEAKSAPSAGNPSDGQVRALVEAVGRRTARAQSDGDSYDYFADLEEHDNHTVAQIDELVLPGVGELAADVDSEMVTAAMCADDHPNPVHRTSCRVCGGAVAATSRTRVPRPSLGTVVSSAGESFELTGPIIVGRKPRVDRVQGPQIPRLLPLPHGHVSANHLQLRTEGWTVLAVDLHSRNGTFLRRQGQPTVRLPESPTPLVAGDVLDLGQGVALTFRDLP